MGPRSAARRRRALARPRHRHDAGARRQRGGTGSCSGLRDIVARAGGRRIYAAGGVRDRADIEALAAAGAAGVLVAIGAA